MTRVDPKSPEFLRYYAAVVTREADIRAGDPFADTLRSWAARALAQADMGPVQMSLFDSPASARKMA